MATRKSRAKPATIEGMLKLKSDYEKKQQTFYAACAKVNKYEARVKDLGNGYSETINGVQYVIALTEDRAYNRKLNIIECIKK